MTKAVDPAAQIAALPIHFDKKGKLRVLMITSRETGRWVMPKGWLMDGKKPWQAAEIEALEEAGAEGHITNEAIGVYHYKKRMPGDRNLKCRVTVYPMMVVRLKRRWKERGQRRRHWFSPERAASLVDETELSNLLQSLTEKPRKQPAIRQLLKAS